MSRLFVDKTIEIDALPFKVWDVLTKSEYTSRWAPEFSGGAPLRIESDWRMGAPVLWLQQDNQTLVEGNVTRLEPEKFLRYTVFDVRSARPTVTEEDGITFELGQREARTVLHIIQGDFSAMPDGAKYQQMSSEVWDRVLPKIKQLAERPLDNP